MTFGWVSVVSGGLNESDVGFEKGGIRPNTACIHMRAAVDSLFGSMMVLENSLSFKEL